MDLEPVWTQCKNKFMPLLEINHRLSGPQSFILMIDIFKNSKGMSQYGCHYIFHLTI